MKEQEKNKECTAYSLHEFLANGRVKHEHICVFFIYFVKSYKYNSNISSFIIFVFYLLYALWRLGFIKLMRPSIAKTWDLNHIFDVDKHFEGYLNKFRI